MEQSNPQHTSQQHLLVCLSSSPSNARIIRTAGDMARAFDCTFTALYVEKVPSDMLQKEDRTRLASNIRLAEQQGARIVTVSGEEISYQIAEFARLSKVTKIVIGRSNVNQSLLSNTESLTKQLSDAVPNIDIFIVPDSSNNTKYREKRRDYSRRILPTYKDLLVVLLMLALSTGLSWIFSALHFTEANIVTVYILGVLVASLFTNNYICNLICSLGAVLLFNFLFTEPRFSLYAYSSGYPVTFIIMLLVSLIMGSLAVKLREQAQFSARSAYRTKVLFDTNMLLQGVKNEGEVFDITATHLVKLLERDVVVYTIKDNQLTQHKSYSVNGNNSTIFSQNDINMAELCLHNAGQVLTDSHKDSKCTFFPVSINQKQFGVIGIDVKATHLDSLDKSIITSILGECALAIDNIRNSQEKEEQAIQAKNEQLRANLLRTISHDLKTPLTAISGNAEYLLANDIKIDDVTTKQIYTDIYNDSIWLNGLVENLLAITRLDKGRTSINFSTELIEDIINEAISRTDIKKTGHKLSVNVTEELLLVKADARLIVQVIINLVQNAIKYTPQGTQITITAQRQGDKVLVSVADNGNGIADKDKDKVFEMFYTGSNGIADSRRSLGLGLSLCKTIIDIHNGNLVLTDNVPHGSVFSFTLPIGEVTINE